MQGTPRPREQTLVSALFDLRRRVGPTQRTIDFYQGHAEYVLALRAPLVLTLDPELVPWATGRRAAHGLLDRTRIIARPLEALSWHDRLDEIASLPSVANDSPRATAPEQRVVQWSKLELLGDAVIANEFATEHFAWIDAGIRHVARPPLTFPEPSDLVAMLEMRAVLPDELRNRREFFDFERGRLASGLIRGRGDVVLELVEAFRGALDEAVAWGMRPNEQMLLSALSADRPELFSLYLGDYATILRNWDGVRGDVPTVLLNIAHCRSHDRWADARERCVALRRALDAEMVQATDDELAHLAAEERIAAERTPPAQQPSRHTAGAPQVSVVIPVFNGAQTIERSVQSVLDQTHADLEVIVVDDASTDSSAAIVAGLAASDARVRLVRRSTNSGSPATPRDDGVAASSAALVALLDQDDYWLPDKLARQLPRFDDPSVAVVYSNAYVVDGAKAPRLSPLLPEGDLAAELAKHDPVPALTAVVRRTWLERVGRFDDGALVGTDDHFMWARIAFAGGRFAAVQDALAVHVEHEASLGVRRAQETWDSAWQVYAMLASRFPGHPAAVAQRPTIALCMIVRDEAAVIERCISSVREIIDSWVIVDTGSTDATPELIKEALADIPGELHHRPWRDFGANRTELLELARGRADHLLLLDADMTVRVDGPVVVTIADAHLVEHDGPLAYAVPRLVRGDRAWRFHGATHEHLAADEPFTTGVLTGLTVVHHADGGSRANKLTRDRGLLEAAIAADPSDARTTFYLAQTYRDLGDTARALELYRKRVELGGWDEEVFYAAFSAAALVADVHWAAGLPLLLEAWERRPVRAEPLYELAVRARAAGQPHLAHMATSLGVGIDRPDDVLFVHRWVYDWGMRFEHAAATSLVGDLATAIALDTELLDDPATPSEVRGNIRLRLEWCRRQLDGGGATPLLGELVPAVRLHPLSIPTTEGWPLTNPSVASDGDGYLCILRSVNYRLIAGRYHMIDGGDVVRTVNHLVGLDSDLEVRWSKPLSEPSSPARYPTRVLGLEDARLFAWRSSWWVSATSRDLDPDARCRMVLAAVDAPHLRDLSPLDAPQPAHHEKNWMPFTVGDELLFVYGCHPFTVLRWDETTRRLHEVVQQVTPAVFAGLRGGSQGVEVDGGHLFVVHEANDGATGRRYAHRFLAMDAGFRPTGLSQPFTFVREGVEFCAGMARQGEELIMSFGIEDASAMLASIRLDDAIGLIEPIDQ